MAHALGIFPIEKLTLTSFSETVTIMDLYQRLERLERECKEMEGMSDLIDLREATHLNQLSFVVMAGIAARQRQHPERNRRGKLAIVCAENELSYGLGRMYGSLTQDLYSEYAIFHSGSEALHWLGHQPEQFLSPARSGRQQLLFMPI